MLSRILYEDKDIIVAYKPAGLPVQTARVGQPDMVSELKNHLCRARDGKDTSAGRGEPYLGIVHRLDQPVEGLLVFAKTPAAAKSLGRQLQTSGFGKHYLAVLSAVPTQTEADLEDYLVKDGRTNTSRVCTSDTPGAKPARLHYHVLRTRDSLALAEIILDTGRHHQIRVQMAHIGCPIAGDAKYTQASPGQARSISGPLQLYAVKLSFCHPATGEPLSFCHTPQLPF